MVVWRSSSVLVSINEVNRRRARWWVTVSRFNSRCRTFISVCNQPLRSTQPGIPSWIGTSTSQRAVMPYGWEVKAGVVRVWVASKTVWSRCFTQAISDYFRDKGLIIKHCINSSLYFTLLYLLWFFSYWFFLLVILFCFNFISFLT